jgi:hypothetical protein
MDLADALATVVAQRTEYVAGEWRFPADDGAEPAAVVTYAEEPSPETGHVGWCWWALGAMGEAASYTDACAAAESALKKRLNETTKDQP